MEVIEVTGGADGTRTRDPRRDRPDGSKSPRQGKWLIVQELLALPTPTYPERASDRASYGRRVDRRASTAH